MISQFQDDMKEVDISTFEDNGTAFLTQYDQTTIEKNISLPDIHDTRKEVTGKT